MKRIIVVIALMLALSASAAEVVKVDPFELHNSFWMSLHQTLIADVIGLVDPDLSALSEEDRAAWTEAVEIYRAAGSGGDLIFDRPMIITNDALAQIADDATTPEIYGPLAEALNAAAPVYRKHWWPSDQLANGFFIAYAEGMLRAAADELIRAHEVVYGAEWPELVRVYVAPYGGPYGAYTMFGKEAGVISTVSSRDPGYQGFAALEMILHESSHAIVSPRRGRVAGAISTAAERRDAEPPRNLWHAILFATTSELTRQYLSARGVEYVPSSEDLLTRAWPHYRAPIEKHWYAYIDGEGTLEDALDRIVGEIVNE